MKYLVLPNSFGQVSSQKLQYFKYRYPHIDETYKTFYKDFQNLTVKERKEYFRQFIEHQTVDERDNIDGLETGTIVGVVKNDKLQKVFMIPDNENNRFVKFDILTKNDNGTQLYSFDIRKLNYSQYNHYIMRYDDFQSMLNDFIRDGVIVNTDNIILETYKSNLLEKSNVKIYDNYDDYKWRNGCIKCDYLVIDDELKKQFQDEYNRHMLRQYIKHAKQSINKFLQNQTSYDDVSDFERILDSI